MVADAILSFLYSGTKAFDKIRDMSGDVEIVSRSDSSKKGSKNSQVVNKVSCIHTSQHGCGKQAEPIEDSRIHAETADSEKSGILATTSIHSEVSEVDSIKSQHSAVSETNVVFARLRDLEVFISTIFTVVSALKSAYIKLQAAHSPYNVEKLQSADRAVIDELKKLSEMKYSYWESHGAPEENTDSFHKSYEGIIKCLRSEIQQKNLEMEKLKGILEQTISRNEKLEQQMKRLEQRLTRDLCPKNCDAASPTTHLFESVFLAASEMASSFAKILVSHMNAAHWDLDAASNSIVPGILYLHPSYKKYAFESHVCQRMFIGFENVNFDLSSSLADCKDNQQACFKQFQDMQNSDPWEILNAQPDCLFGKFCCKKFLNLIHPKMEESFFGNLEHRNQVESGIHPHTHFYDNFLSLAKSIWLLHRLAFAFEPAASIFQVRRNTEFSPMYMESVVSSLENEVSDVSLHKRVGFTVVPGFRVGKTIIKCRVYIMPMQSV